MWPPASPDLNTIENVWATVKMKLYASGKQYENKGDLWDAIQTVCKYVHSKEMENLTNSLVCEKKGGHIGM